MFRIHYQGLVYTTTTARTAQAACRKAFKYWINSKLIKRQPKTDRDGGFEGVEYEVVKV